MKVERPMESHSHHTRNTTYFGFVEIFWGLGMNLLSMGTVLPVFLQERGASNAVIAFLPALSALGAGLTQAFSPLLVGRRWSLKGMVLWMHVLCPIPVALIGAGLLWGRLPVVPEVLILWGVFYACIGLLYPLWMDYMARALDPARRGRAFGTIFLTQTLAGALGVTAAAALLKGGTSDGRYALLFFIGAVTMAGGSLFFVGTVEDHTGEVAAPAATVGGHFKEFWHLWRSSPWLKGYMVQRWLVRGTYPLLIHFYAVFAVTKKGVSPATAALYGAAALGCQALAGVAAGALGDRLGHKASVLLGQGGLLAACLLAVLPVPGWAFFGVAGLTGAFMATEYTSQATWIMDLAPPRERQRAISMVGFLLTPASVLVPLAGGSIMDHAGFPPVIAGVACAVAAAMAIVALSTPARPRSQSV